MPIEQLLLNIGGWALFVYVIFRDIAVPLFSKVIPLKEKKDEHKMMMEERTVKAQEDIAQNLTVIAERMTNLEKEYKAHDDRQSVMTSQVVTTLSAMQAGVTVLLDRRMVARVPEEDKEKKSKYGQPRS